MKQFYPDLMFEKPTQIKSIHKTEHTTHAANIPAFPEFNTPGEIEIYCYKFHDYFHGMLGHIDMQKLGFNIDLKNNILSNENCSIPIQSFFRHKFMHNLNVHYKIPANCGQIIKFPVDQNNGDFLLHQQTIADNVIIPSQLIRAKNHFALIEVQNRTDTDIDIRTDNILQTHNFDEIDQQEIHNHEFAKISHNDKEPVSTADVENLIRTTHLQPREKYEIIRLCSKYVNILQLKDQPLTFTSKVKHFIKTTEEEPVHAKTYRYPYIHRQEIQTQIDEMLRTGVIQPSESPWSSPVWIVAKKQDASGKKKWRMVIDYRKLNEKTISNRYPLPNITDVLDVLGKAKFYSVLDLASGFHQIEMHPVSVAKTAFTVDNGHNEFTRMPFGLKNAPATFQNAMDDVLRSLQGKVCMVYMDDIIIFSEIFEQHLHNLDQVFSKLEEHNLKIQLDKCEFLCREVQFLGHIVTPDGIKPNPAKIAAIKNFPIPKTRREIKSFLGILSYYRRFIPNFAKISREMTKNLKKDAVINIKNPQYIACFNQCKDLLTSEPVLAYPNLDKPFELVTDASNYAIGAVLEQQGRPNHEINYSTIEKELLAIIFGCSRFRPYLFGKTFKIKSDHKPLSWLFNVNKPNSRLVRWRLEL